jgi:hypothetical protein
LGADASSLEAPVEALMSGLMLLIVVTGFLFVRNYYWFSKYCRTRIGAQEGGARCFQHTHLHCTSIEYCSRRLNVNTVERRRCHAIKSYSNRSNTYVMADSYLGGTR